MPTNTVVLLKHVYDESQLKVDPATGGIDFSAVPGKMSSFDRNAVEEALRLRQQLGGTVTSLTLGTDAAVKSIREALAMGVDRAVLVRTSGETDAYAAGALLEKALARLQPWGLLLCAEGSTDTYTSLLPGMLAQRLGLPLISYARSLKLDGGALVGERSLERKTVTVRAALPAIASVVSEINEPRIPTLLQIMGAAKKELSVTQAESLGVTEQGYRTESMSGKGRERKRVVIEGPVQEAVSRLLDAMTREGVV
ncbi:MAG: electron transfer flavoprotein subunit beta/FixA family protein [Nitrososphaerota archaeon]|nr:electron transfer flavoprotein subunit beta/FixA family protein [Nitrososphaerota archaeon]